jgi:hypothetical protein
MKRLTTGLAGTSSMVGSTSRRVDVPQLGQNLQAVGSMDSHLIQLSDGKDSNKVGERSNKLGDSL